MKWKNHQPCILINEFNSHLISSIATIFCILVEFVSMLYITKVKLCNNIATRKLESMKAKKTKKMTFVQTNLTPIEKTRSICKVLIYIWIHM